LQTLLQGQGWSVEFADECVRLGELLNDMTVTVVISETQLQSCQADEVLSVCKQQHVPVIFTGYDVPAQVAVDLIQQGGHDYLEKPFAQKRLINLLNRLTNRHND
jgi:DNA-binding NtrC family response regulator